MADTISLTSGMRANLWSLQKTSSLMELTQSRLSTGKRVQSALDDPVKFFAAQGHTQRAMDLSGRKADMGEAIQLIKAADAGIESLTTLIESAKSLAQAALSAETTTEINTLETQYQNLVSQIDDLAGDSGYKGINLLDGSLETLDVKFDENGDSKITLTGFLADSSADGLSLDVVAANDWNSTSAGGTADRDQIATAIAALDTAKTTLRSEASELANNLTTITTRQDFTQNMINTLEDGAAKLTDADMNEEGANMLMLQTRQSLGVNSLAMASQAAQQVLRLF
jgi:flagellin-like hook-associated protein FlgL